MYVFAIVDINTQEVWVPIDWNGLQWFMAAVNIIALNSYPDFSSKLDSVS